MEFTYEIDKQKALLVAKENVIYSYAFRKRFANIVFSIITILAFIGFILSIVPRLNILQLLISAILILFLVSMILKGEELQIYALQEQTKRLYKEKSVIKYGVVIDSKQLAFMKKDGTQKSYKLKSIKHLRYRLDLEGLFFSESKLARYVYFIDLSNLDKSTRLEIFNIILNNLVLG
jgi:predicted membrane protein